MIRCCIFDLDGTLLNTLDALTYTTNLTLKEFGYGPVEMCIRDRDKLGRQKGKSPDHQLRSQSAC